ncbi:UNVERIFIED_ORG: hypothetical protein FHR35_001297 [Microbispora rosea subsp. rosea]
MNGARTLYAVLLVTIALVLAYVIVVGLAGR